MKTPSPALPTAGLVLALLAPASRAVCQTRPLLTEEATTAASGTIVLETGGEFMRDEPSFLTGAKRDVARGPLFCLIFSPADAVEVDVEWVAKVAAFKDPTYGDVSDWGDVTLRTKVRVLDGGPKRPTLALRYALTLPETSFGNGLGLNVLRMSAEALVSQPVAGFTLHGNLGMYIEDSYALPHEQRDLLVYGAAFERPLGTQVSLVGEVAGLVGADSASAANRTELRAGLRLGSRRLRVDAALRRGLAVADGTWGVTAGLHWALAGR